MVSVHIITYNHVKYIRQTVESVLMQKTSFDFEIIIGDDFSTDGTREVLLSLQKQYPEKIRLLLHPHNLGPPGFPGKLNFIRTFLECKRSYIAFLDGDDYWTNPFKLQMQIDFLEQNSDYVLSAHNAIYSPDSEICEVYSNDTDASFKTYSVEDLLDGNFLTASTIVFRNIVALPDWFIKLQVGDWPLYLILCNRNNGKIHFINQYMAVYRMHDTGVFSSISKKEQVLRVMDATRILHEEKLFVNNSLAVKLEKLYALYVLQYLSLLQKDKVEIKHKVMWYIKSVRYVKYYNFAQVKYLLTYFPILMFRR